MYAALEDNYLILTRNGGGGGNRTRVRMVSDDRVYVRRLRSFSIRPVAKSGGTGPSLTCFSLPATVRQRSGSQPSDDARDPLEGVEDGRRYASFS